MDELWFLNFFHALKLFNINFKINALSLLVCLFVFRKVKIALKEVLPKKKKKRAKQIVGIFSNLELSTVVQGVIS